MLFYYIDIFFSFNININSVSKRDVSFLCIVKLTSFVSVYGKGTLRCKHYVSQ